MALSDDLKQKRKTYYTLKEEINKIISLLFDGISEFNSMKQFSECYSINSDSADNGKLIKIKEEIIQIHKAFKNKTIESINNKIEKINKDIKTAEANEARLIEEEKKKAEEAKKKKAEQN